MKMAIQSGRGGWRGSLLILFLLAACGLPVAAPPPTPAIDERQDKDQAAGLELPAGYWATPITSGLVGPTQMILGPDGRLWVAQLAGGENEGRGQIVAVDLASGEQTVLLENLLKPVGIAVLDSFLWIAARNDLLRAPISGGGDIGQVESVLADLPFNGRSIGTLTVSPAGRLIYETSGARSGNEAVAGSAALWELDPADPTNPQVIATGLKNGYAHAFDAAGRLWLTDIADDPVNGQPPPDELNLWSPNADFGWPKCFGPQTPATNYGGDQAFCRTTRPAVALFPPRSTPTSIIASPWEEHVLLVALWLESVVLRVPVTIQGDNAVGAPEPFLTGLRNPQHLLALADGSLLVSDFATGTVYQIQAVE
jgi:glucose/arabinose dehydrogenase